MKCDRKLAFLVEIINDWDKLNLAAKVLVFLSGFLFTITIFVALYKVNSTDIYRTIEVIFRSSLASVFGFILSSNIKNIKPKDIPYIEKRSIKIDDETKEDCQDLVEKRYRNEGNSVQILIAFLVTIISAIVIIIIYVFEITNDTAVLSQFRDLMCVSIGFLLGESKIKKNN